MACWRPLCPFRHSGRRAGRWLAVWRLLASLEEADAATAEPQPKEYAVDKAKNEKDVKYKTEEAGSLDYVVMELSSDRDDGQSEHDTFLSYLGESEIQCIVEPETYAEPKTSCEAETAGSKVAPTAAGSLDQAVTEWSSDRDGVQSEHDVIHSMLGEIDIQCIDEPETYTVPKVFSEAEIAELKEALSTATESLDQAFLTYLGKLEKQCIAEMKSTAESSDKGKTYEFQDGNIITVSAERPLGYDTEMKSTAESSDKRLTSFKMATALLWTPNARSVMILR